MSCHVLVVWKAVLRVCGTSLVFLLVSFRVNDDFPQSVSEIKYLTKFVCGRARHFVVVLLQIAVDLSAL